MNESFQTKLLRWGFNLFPAFRRTGGRITHIAADNKLVKLKIPLNWKTRNYVGSIFGGSIYGAVDPIYMIMFIKLLGKGYIVWDKASQIQFKKPGRTTLLAEFVIDDKELLYIKNELDKKGKIDRQYQIRLYDVKRNLCAVIEKIIYFRKENF